MSLVHKHASGKTGRFDVVVGKTTVSDLNSEADIEISSGGERIPLSKPSYVDDSVLQSALTKLLEEVRSARPRARRRHAQ